MYLEKEDGIVGRITVNKLIIIILLILTFSTILSSVIIAKSEGNVSDENIKWSLKPSEAYDSILFLNAISKMDKYSSHYPGLREEWQDKLGSTGLELVDTATARMSMSNLSIMLSYLNIQTLDDIIYAFRHPADTRKKIEKGLLEDDPGKESSRWQYLDYIMKKEYIYLSCFEKLKEAGFDSHWRKNIKLGLDERAKYNLKKLEPYSLARIRENISRFLDRDKIPSGTKVYLTYYGQPISFQLPDGMVTSGSISSIERFVTISIHESLHNFPRSSEVIEKFKKKIEKSRRLKKQYREQIEEYKSGPEEYFVIAAEAYLSEILGIRSFEECKKYLNTYHGGMPLSLEIYKLLRENKPDSKKEWEGYGTWLINKIENDAFTTLSKKSIFDWF